MSRSRTNRPSSERSPELGSLSATLLSRRSALRLAGASAIAAGAVALPMRAAVAKPETVVYASDFGFDPLDSTDALQAALDSTATTVIIDNVGADWLARPLFLTRDDVTVILEPGTVVRAKPGGYPGNMDRLLTVVGASDIAIIGYGATMTMNKAEYTDVWAYKHVLDLLGVTRCTVEGLTLSNSGGDGIYIGVVDGVGQRPYSEDVVIRNVRCDNNRRNGLSVISVQNLLVEGCAFVNSTGHSPEAGIDLEPNNSAQRLANVVIRECVMEGTTRSGVVIYLKHLTTATDPLSILFDRVRIGSNEDNIPSFLYVGSGTDSPGGTIEIRDSLVQTSPYCGSLTAWKKTWASESLKFTRTIASSWGSQFDTYSPLSVLPSTVTEFGGVTWEDVLVVNDADQPFFAVQQESATTIGVRSIHGNVTVFNPYGARVELGKNPVDVTLTYREATTIPATTVEVSTAQSSVNPGDSISVVFTRNGGDIVAPLAIRYAISGTADPRVDLHGASGMVVIPPGATSATRLIQTRSRDDGTSISRNMTLTVTPMEIYQIGAQDEISVTINAAQNRRRRRHS